MTFRSQWHQKRGVILAILFLSGVIASDVSGVDRFTRFFLVSLPVYLANVDIGRAYCGCVARLLLTLDYYKGQIRK